MDFKIDFNQTPEELFMANVALTLACEKIDKLSPTCPSGELDFLSDECTKEITCAQCWKRYFIKIVKGEK